MMPRLLIIATILSWLAVIGLVAQTNLIGFTTATLRWPNVKQPTTVFHWAAANTNRGTISADTETVVYVSVPRQFTTATLNVSTQESDGQLQVKVDSSGNNNAQVAGQAGSTVSLPLVWSQLATKTRPFTVRLRAINATVTITSMSLTIRQ